MYTSWTNKGVPVVDYTGTVGEDHIYLGPAWVGRIRPWKCYSATCSTYTKHSGSGRKSVYSLPVDRVSAFQEFPSGQRRSGHMSPGQSRQEQQEGR